MSTLFLQLPGILIPKQRKCPFQLGPRYPPSHKGKPSLGSTILHGTNYSSHPVERKGKALSTGEDQPIWMYMMSQSQASCESQSPVLVLAPPNHWGESTSLSRHPASLPQSSTGAPGGGDVEKQVFWALMESVAWYSLEGNVAIS